LDAIEFRDNCRVCGFGKIAAHLAAGEIDNHKLIGQLVAEMLKAGIRLFSRRPWPRDACCCQV